MRLSDVATIGAGDPAPQGKQYYEGGTYLFVRTQDVGRVKYSRKFQGTKDKVNNKAVKEKGLRLWPKGTTLLPKSGASTLLNNRVRLSEPAYVSSHLATVIPKDCILSLFLYYNLCQLDVRRLLRNPGYPSLSIEDLGSVRISLPPLKEQKIISSSLDSIDEMIEMTENVTAKTEQLREALLHELLTRGASGHHGEWIEVPGKARPPPPWKVVKLGDIAEVQKGTSFTSKELVPGDIPVIAGGREPAYYHRYSNRPSNAITISASGAASGYVSFHREPIFATDCTTVLSKSELSITNYIYYFLKHSQSKIYRLRTGSALPHLYPRDITRFEVVLPPLEEQILIVKYLDIISEVIDQNRQVINYQSMLRDALLHELLIRGLPDNHNYRFSRWR